MPRILPLMVTVALLSGCAAAAGELLFPSVDANDDGRVSQGEFAEFLDDTDAFDRYDDNDDGQLSRQEYREAVDSSIAGDDYFRGFDRDRSGGLSESEFSSGIFRVYDRDGNGWLSEDEFEDAALALSPEL